MENYCKFDSKILLIWDLNKYDIQGVYMIGN